MKIKIADGKQTNKARKALQKAAYKNEFKPHQKPRSRNPKDVRFAA